VLRHERIAVAVARRRLAAQRLARAIKNRVVMVSLPPGVKQAEKGSPLYEVAFTPLPTGRA
jgi:hypothetical protein